MTQTKREERERGSMNCPFGNLSRWRDTAKVHRHRQHFGHRNERAIIASRPLLTHAGDIRLVSRRVEVKDEEVLVVRAFQHQLETGLGAQGLGVATPNPAIRRGKRYGAELAVPFSRDLSQYEALRRHVPRQLLRHCLEVLGAARGVQCCFLQEKGKLVPLSLRKLGLVITCKQTLRPIKITHAVISPACPSGMTTSAE